MRPNLSQIHTTKYTAMMATRVLRQTTTTKTRMTASGRLTTRGHIPSAEIEQVNPQVFINEFTDDDGEIHTFEKDRFYHRLSDEDEKCIPHIKNERIEAMAAHKNINSETFLALSALVKSDGLRFYGTDPKKCDNDPWLEPTQLWAKTLQRIIAEEVNNDGLRNNNEYDLQALIKRYFECSLGNVQTPWMEQRFAIVDAGYDGGVQQYMADWRIRDTNGLAIARATPIHKEVTPNGTCFLYFK